MSRLLKRVPMDFSWPKDKVWKGYINPYSKLMIDCPACVYDGNGPRGYAPRARQFHQEWYGYVEFDPVAYGATPIQRDHPRIREFATAQAKRNPNFFTGPDALEREISRLHEICIKNHWCHHLIQDDVDALVTEGRLRDFTHRPRDQEQVDMLKAQAAAGESEYWLKESNGYHPSADEINNWALFGMGHDSINQTVCIRARCAREGVAVECPSCLGKGYGWGAVNHNDLPYLTEGLLRDIKPVDVIVPASDIERLYEDWQGYEPPAGPGFQLWENCSEGSPVSPVFPSLEELCVHCERHQSTFGYGNFVSKERWRQMLDANFVHHAEPAADGGTLIFI